MANIRTAALTGAALIALAAIVTETAYAQGPGAPLELVPGPNQARPTRGVVSSRNATKTSAKKTAAKSENNRSENIKSASNRATNNKSAAKKTASKSPRQVTAERPVPKTAAAKARTNTDTAASRRENRVASNAQRGRATPKQAIIRTAVVPYLTVSRPVLRRGTREPPVIAHGPSVETPEDRVIRGGDSVSLVATLPWWRNDRMQDVTYGSAAAESKVIEAAAVWLAANGGQAEDERSDRAGFGHPAMDEAVEVADADEINEIDLAAGSVPPEPPGFMQSLLALIGGVAAAAVASARMLFA